MTANDIHDAIETFARYGVPRERIFNEVMRARYLDYVLFLNPENVQYGISIDDLYENMKRTADKLGMYEGDADTYARFIHLRSVWSRWSLRRKCRRHLPKCMRCSQKR